MERAQDSLKRSRNTSHQEKKANEAKKEQSSLNQGKNEEKLVEEKKTIEINEVKENTNQLENKTSIEVKKEADVEFIAPIAESFKMSNPSDSPKPEANNEPTEKEIDLLGNPESPRPAPPVFEDFDTELFFNKEEREAKEKAAVEKAQRMVSEHKANEELESNMKKQALSELEDKYENIAAKYK